MGLVRPLEKKRIRLCIVERDPKKHKNEMFQQNPYTPSAAALAVLQNANSGAHTPQDFKSRAGHQVDFFVDPVTDPGHIAIG